MSVDGRDESLGDGDPETGGGLTSPQVPSQGGPGGVEYLDTPLGGSVDGSFDSSGYPEYLDDPMEGSVPAQRGRGVLPPRSDSVLPPPIELPPSDTDLIGRMRSGDDTAYEELYRRHADAVRRYARTCCRDGHTADDLTAEVFARMLQAVRGGSGPEYAVRAYLLTSVRRVAANWTTSAKREQLVDDFAVFAAQAARGSETSTRSGVSAMYADNDTLDLGADVRAMHQAEQSMAMQAFRSLPERWQAVLWHTEVEDESPSEVATLFGLDANGTRVLASRAREGLKQAYLQAHVSATLATDEECSRYADRLGAYARGGLRSRAERGLRKHLEECAKCRAGRGPDQGSRQRHPGRRTARGHRLVRRRRVRQGGRAGRRGRRSGCGGRRWCGGRGERLVVRRCRGRRGSLGRARRAGEGGDRGRGRRRGRRGGRARAGRRRQPGEEAGGPGPVRAGDPAGGADTGPHTDSAAARAGARGPGTGGPLPHPHTHSDPDAHPEPHTDAGTDSDAQPDPDAHSQSAPGASATASSAAARTGRLPVERAGVRHHRRRHQTRDAARREQLGVAAVGVSIADKQYAHGVTVHGESSVTVDLNRDCASYDALVGVDDMALGLGQVYFSVFADGERMWRSELIQGGQEAVPVHVDLTGRKTIRLVVEPHSAFDSVALADWAESKFMCR